jgi:hypothetical protein
VGPKVASSFIKLSSFIHVAAAAVCSRNFTTSCLVLNG